MRGNRPGYVIVELMLAMSSLLIIFGICVLLMHGLLRLDRVSRAHLAEATGRDRIARQFRIDVRSASAAKPGQEDATPADHLELNRPDGRIIEYRVVKGQVVRDEHDKGGRTYSHEAYRLPSRERPRFQARQENQGWFIRLDWPAKPGAVLERRRSPDPGSEALLSKDLRFDGTRGGTR